MFFFRSTSGSMKYLPSEVNNHTCIWVHSSRDKLYKIQVDQYKSQN